MGEILLSSLKPDNDVDSIRHVLQSIDWSKTSMGPLHTWPASLQATLALMWPSAAEIVLFYGPNFIAFYNDAYAPTIGDKHPRAFGRPARENWSELWNDLEPLLRRVYVNGETIAARDRPFYIERHAKPERVYFDISYSPLRDENGAIIAVFCVVNETTQRVSLERSLKKSQDQLTCALDAAGMVGIFDWNIVSDTVQGDSRFAELFSIDPLYAQTGVPIDVLLKGIHPDDRKRVWEAIQDSKTRHWKFAEEYRVCGAHGNIRWVDARGECLYDNHGEPLRFTGAIIDVTARKRMEEALRESEARANAIFAQTTTGIAQTDLGGQFMFVNDRYSQIIGYPKEALFGKAIYDFIHPDDLAHSLDLFATLVQSGESFETEKRCVRKDGSIVWVNNSASPIRDRDGMIAQVVITMVDITARKQAEEGVNQLAAIISSSDDAILSLDLNRTIRSWNEGAVRLYGYSAEEIIGCPVTVLLPEDHTVESETTMQLIARGERVETYETKRKRKNGDILDVSLTVSPILDQDGRIIGVSKIARDITTKKEAERLTRVLMGELKHRVKNVLATVQAIARQTFRRADGHPDLLNTFTARLTALARAHDLLTRENWEEAELSTLLRETLEPYSMQRFTMGGPVLKLRPRSVIAMSLAIHELATNAAKYGALSVPGGHIRILWTVTDKDGHDFELFWQEQGGPPVTTPDEKGFGSKLITQILAAELAGNVELMFEPHGLVCKIAASTKTYTADNSK